MGCFTQEEIEGLLRDNLKAFCEKNFEFENELTVYAHVSFLSDNDVPIVCDLHETVLAKSEDSWLSSKQRSNVIADTSMCNNLEKLISTDKIVLGVKSEPLCIEPIIDTYPAEETINTDVGRPTICPDLKDEPVTVSDDDPMQDLSTTEDDTDFTDITTKSHKKKIIPIVTSSVGKHPCSVCGKIYAKPNRLKVHERTHTGDKPFTCDKCNKSYRSTYTLRMHQRKGCLDLRMKGSMELLAQQGLEDAANLTAIGTIVKAVSSSEELPKRRDCKFCNKSFPKPCRLLIHERKHTGDRPFVCTKCAKGYVSIQGLRTHYIRGCDDRRKKLALDPHNLRKKKALKHICKDCGKAYAKRNRLLVHERTQHTGERPFLCATCGKAYASKMTLNQHTLIHTNGKCFICSVCNASFLLPYALKIHMRVHTGERPHVCWHCGRAFRQYGSFQVHLRTHTKEKPLKCSKCDNRFAHRSLLLKHEMMHEGERKFKCTQCDKSFWTSHELKTHTRTHLGIKRHVCPKCSMRFTQISSLKRHIDGHTGTNKAHSCTVCGKTFTRAHQVSIHMKVHNTTSPYRCQICNTNFKSMSGCRAHMASNHPEQQHVILQDQTDVGLEVEVPNDAAPVSDPSQKQLEPLNEGDAYIKSMLQLPQYQQQTVHPQLSMPVQFAQPRLALMPNHITPTQHHLPDSVFHQSLLRTSDSHNIHLV